MVSSSWHHGPEQETTPIMVRTSRAGPTRMRSAGPLDAPASHDLPLTIRRIVVYPSILNVLALLLLRSGDGHTRCGGDEAAR